MRRLVKTFTLLCLSILTSCTSTTTLKSTSSNAKIYADGKYLGEGAVTYSDTKIIGSSTTIELKQPGYRDKIATISRSGQLNAGALIGAILLAPTVIGALLILWVMDYDSYYVFDLDKDDKK